MSNFLGGKMVKTEYFISYIKTNFLMLIVRLISNSGAIIWIAASDVISIQDKYIILIVYSATTFIYSIFFIIRFFVEEKDQETCLFCIFTFLIDQIVVSYFIYNTGGYSSPFYSGYFVVITLAAFVLGLRSAIIVSIAAALFFTLFNIKYDTTFYDYLDLIYRIVPLIIIAFPTGILSDIASKHIKEIDSLNEKLEVKNEKLEKSLIQIETMQKQLLEREKEKALIELTENVAHHMRNPLMSLGGMANVMNKSLKKKKNIEDITKYAQYIESESKKLSTVLDNLLQISNKTLDLKFVSINNVINKLTGNFEDEIKSKGIRLVVETDNTIPPIRLDEKKISIAINNIIDHCLQFIKKDDILKVETKYNKDYIPKKTVYVKILCTGVVIHKDVLKNIFEPFVAGDDTKRGLGLPIAKHSIELLGGTLDIESQVDKGTTFTVTLPV